MKCPECGFVSFDDMYVCSKCGKIFDADKLQSDFIDQITIDSETCRDLPRPKNLESTISSIKKDLDHITDKKNQLKKAGFLKRLTAYLIDWMVLSLISVFLLFNVYILLIVFSNSNMDIYETLNSIIIPFYLFSFLLKCFYFSFFHSLTGQTVGKSLCKIKVVDLNGKRISFMRSFVRFLGYYLCFYSCGIGFIWILFNENNQGWHDKLAGSIVILK